LLLRHCLWTTEDNREKVIKIVEEAVKKNGLKIDISLSTIDEEKNELEKDINKEIFHSIDVYETTTLDDDKEYFRCIKKYRNDTQTADFYIAYEKTKSSDIFNPVDKDGNEFDWIECNYKKQGVCFVKICEYHNNAEPYKEFNFSPKISFHQGDKKSDVCQRIIGYVQKDTAKLKTDIEANINEVEAKLNTFKNELDTPFVPDNIQNIALESIFSQIKNLKLRQKDCERIMGLID
jgi:MoxR-like ATPase